MKNLLACLLPCAAFALPVAASAQTTLTDGQALRADLLRHYPSLAWIERYRHAFPAEAQGNELLWRSASVPALESAGELTDALAALQDQHIGLGGEGRQATNAGPAVSHQQRRRDADVAPCRSEYDVGPHWRLSAGHRRQAGPALARASRPPAPSAATAASAWRT